jgi:hypothetical protein
MFVLFLFHCFLFFLIFFSYFAILYCARKRVRIENARNDKCKEFILRNISVMTVMAQLNLSLARSMLSWFKIKLMKKNSGSRPTKCLFFFLFVYWSLLLIIWVSTFVLFAPQFQKIFISIHTEWAIREVLTFQSSYFTSFTSH